MNVYDNYTNKKDKENMLINIRSYFKTTISITSSYSRFDVPDLIRVLFYELNLDFGSVCIPK